MALAIIEAKVEERDKARFDAFCSSVGMDTFVAINLFAKAVLRQRRIPFGISQSSDPFYSFQNQAYVMKSVNELRAGKGTAHELIEYLDEREDLA